MNHDRAIFSQLMDFVSKHQFNRCVQRYHGNYRTRRFSCYDQFLAMAFGQLTFRQSLRDITTCLRALRPKLYHAGFRSTIARSTLADANEKRSWKIYADFAQGLIAQAQRLYVHESLGLDLQHAAYAFDATTIDLCLTLFPWAQFRRHKSAVKVHTLMDLKSSIPTFIRITSGSIHEVNLLDELPLEAGAFYVMDRAFTDFARLYRFVHRQAFFVIRAKARLDYTRRAYRLVDKSTGLRSDQTIALRGPLTSRLYPVPLRRVSFYDCEHQRLLVFLTNNFHLDPLIIAQLYHYRWRIELFFKWIKQHLRIKAFFGTSENAVKTQIWIAVSVYVLVAIIKKQLHLPQPLSEILQVLSITLFEKVPLQQALRETTINNETLCNHNQLLLFDL